MAPELTLLPFKTDTDILHVHNMAMQLAKSAGADAASQISFAAAVAEKCFAAGSADCVTLTLQEKEDPRRVLKAAWNAHPDTVEWEFAVSANLQPAHSLPDLKQHRWEESYRDMQQLTFALAHDLKNSLTKLRLALSLLEEEKEIPSSIAGYLQIIQRASNRLGSILMGLNKVVEAGDSSPDVVQKLSPELIFADVQDEFADTIAQDGITLAADFAQVPELSYIEVYLKSIFTNLLSNAIKYASPHRPLQVMIHATRQQDQVILSFSDNGQGIDLERVGDKLFLPFTRFSSNTEGSGIGLYLIKTIVERNGGKITVESQPGEGTVFRIVLQEYHLPAAAAVSI